MENSIQVFNNPQFGEIRTAGNADNPLFCLADVCKAVGLTTNGISRRLQDDVISNHPITDSLGRTQQALFVNEDGLYDVILDSRKPEARQFRKWVTSDVLPTIRKTGGYLATSQNDTPELIMARALQVAQATITKHQQQLAQANERIALQDTQLREQAPKVSGYDNYISSAGTFTTTQIAKEYGWGAETLNRKLKERGIQYKQNGQWLLTTKYDGRGYTRSIPRTYTRSDGTTGTQMQTVWTVRGREFIHSIFKAA